MYDAIFHFQYIYVIQSTYVIEWNEKTPYYGLQVYNSYQSLLNGLDLLVQVCLNFPPPPSRPPCIHYNSKKIITSGSVCHVYFFSVSGSGLLITNLTDRLVYFWYSGVSLSSFVTFRLYIACALVFLVFKLYVGWRFLL